MLITSEKNQHNHRLALTLAVGSAVIVGALGYFQPWLLAGWLLCPVIYWLVRRRTLRRQEVMQKPFPLEWEEILLRRVLYFNSLNETDRDRFRKMVLVFLDETRITGIKTEVDDLTRVLVAASAIIPVFGFPDWEYAHLGEVLIYPSSFSEEYSTDETADRTTLGMIGVGHLSGVMILSQPDLIGGFANPTDSRNVGIHEFAHLVDKADGSVDGLPPGITAETARPWLEWVGRELADPPSGKSDIDGYAYTNQQEYFAVLSEYFFEAPDQLERRHPQLYQMMRKMFHQDTSRSLAHAVLPKRQQLGRNSPCPCGSGKKYKQCCLRKARQGMSTG